MNLIALPAITLKDLVAVNEASANRTGGCHVTDIVREIMVKVDPSKYSKDYGDASENWQQAGFVWEDLLSTVLARKAIDEGSSTMRFRPGELIKDGIKGSPDGLCPEDALTVTRKDGTSATYRDILVVEEYKCTWKSSRDFDLYDKRYLWWLLQLQAYCYMAGTTIARLYVLHVNGNYQGYIPETTGWIIEFTPRELREQWDSFLNTARHKGWI